MKSIFVKPGQNKWPRRIESDTLDDPGYLIIIGEPAGLMLGVDQLFVDMYIEDTTPATDQFHIDIIEDLSEFSFQTGSLWQVVSLDTILDRHFHISPHALPPHFHFSP